MRNEIIKTENMARFSDICKELEGASGLIGPSLAMVSGPAGRGKTEAAKHYAVQNGTVYIPPLNTRTPTMLQREICFELCKVRPFRSDECLELIRAEMGKERRLVIIDEADLLPMQILEMLRNLNELFSFPIILIGEDRLAPRIASRRRLSSRIRRRMEFGPVTQNDVTHFFHRALNAKISPEVCAMLHRACGGDWRPLLVKALAIERALRASGLSEISMELAKDVTQHS